MSGVLQRFHKNDRGEMPIGPILILALIVIPLIFFLMSARDKATETTKSQFEDVVSDMGNDTNKIN
jgi:hypothetical protein